MLPQMQEMRVRFPVIPRKILPREWARVRWQPALPRDSLIMVCRKMAFPPADSSLIIITIQRPDMAMAAVLMVRALRWDMAPDQTDTMPVRMDTIPRVALLRDRKWVRQALRWDITRAREVRKWARQALKWVRALIWVKMVLITEALRDSLIMARCLPVSQVNWEIISFSGF